MLSKPSLMLLKILFGICLLLSLSACDLPTRSRFHHEEAIDTDRHLISDGEEELQFPYHLLRLDNGNESNPQFVINEYKSLISDRDQLIAQYRANNQDTRDLIQKWFENVLLLENHNSELEFVIDTLLYNCTDRDKDCPMLPILTSSHLFSLVLEKWVLIHRDSLDSAVKIKKFYSVLHLYLERKSRNINNTIFYSYLINIRNLENLFESSQAVKIALVSRDAFNELTAEVLDLFLKNGSEADIISLVRELNVFNLSGEDLRDPLSRLIFQKGLALGLYIDDVINPAVTSAILAQSGQSDSFNSRFDILSSNHPRMVSNLKLDTDLSRNEYFWIVDALFYNRLGIDEVNWIWDASQKSLEELNRVSYEYLKVQLAFLISWTNKRVGQVFSDDTIAKSELIAEAIRTSELSTVKVLDFLNRVDRIRGFSESTGALREIEGLENRGVNAFFNYLKENIKFLISYNHHLLTTYHISKRQLKSKVRVGGISATTDKYESMIRTFRDPHLRKFPLLFKYGVTTDNYAAGEKKLNFYQLAYVFDFALQTQSFEEFGIDPVDYLQVFYEIVVESRLQYLQKEENWTLKRHDNNSYYQEFLSLCRAVSGEGGYTNEVELDDFTIKPTLGVFTQALFRQSKSSGQVALNPYSLQMAEEIEAYKLIILRDIQFADALTENLKDSLVKTEGVNESEITERFRQISARRSAAMEQLTNYLEGVSRLSKNYDDCYLETISKDKEVMVSILGSEIDHIRKIHQAMTEMRSGGTPDLSFTRFNGYPNSYQGYDEVTEDYLLYHKFDLLIRAKEHMEDAIDYARVKIPNDFARDNTTRGLFTSRQNQRISYEADVDMFIKKVLRAHNIFNIHWLKEGHMSSGLFVFRDTYQIFTNYQRLMHHLGRADEIPTHLKAESKVNYVASLKRYHSMSPEIKEILGYLEQESFLEVVGQSSLIDTFLNDESLYPEPYFYWLLYVSSYERNGYLLVRPSSEVTSQGSINDEPLKADTVEYPHVFEDALDYSQISSPKEHTKFVFPVSEKLRENLDNMVKKRVAAETKAFEDVLNGVKDFECRDRALPEDHPDKMVYEFVIGEPLYEFYADYSRWPGRFFRGQNSFNRRTLDFFVDTTPQVDITPPSCNE